MFARMRRAARLGLAAFAFGMAPALIAAPPASHARAEAMKVELAWMSDARAFALPLEVHGTANGVELHGTVPDEAARQHVVRLARQSCTSTVHDKLTVTAAPSKHENDPLVVSARSLIGVKLGSRAAGIQVSGNGQGTVELRGQVATLEDRYEASHCLRGLAGCKRVENFVEISTGIKQVDHPLSTEEPPRLHTGPLLPRMPAPMPAAMPAHMPAAMPAAPTYIPYQPQFGPQARPQPVWEMGPVTFLERMQAFWNPRAQTVVPAPQEQVLRIHGRVTEPPVAAPVQTAWPPAHRVAPVTQPVAYTAFPAPTLTPAALASRPMPATSARVNVTAGAQWDRPAPLPAVARQLVMGRCGKDIKMMQASLDESGKLILHIHAKPNAEQEVVGQLLQMPELASRNVHIQVHVAQ